MFIYKMDPYNYQSECRWTCIWKRGNNNSMRGMDWGMAKRQSGAVNKWPPDLHANPGQYEVVNRARQNDMGMLTTSVPVSRNSAQHNKGGIGTERKTHHGTQNGGTSKQDGTTSVQHYELRGQPVLATSHATSPTLYGFVNSYFHIKWEWNKMQALSVCVDTCTGILLIRPGLSSL